MSTRGRTATTDAAGDLAGAVREAGFVHLVAAADGDALAAAGLLARGCRAADVPFQASVARTDAERERRLAVDELTVLVGAGRGAADQVVPAGGQPASVTAHAAATDLGAEGVPTLALAGAFAAGVSPGAGGTADLLEAAEAAGAVERRPGVALPTEAVADGLAHQTLVHADFAGDVERAAELARDAGFDGATDVEPDDGDADRGNGTAGHTSDGRGSDGDANETGRQRLASLVALEVAGDGSAAPQAADALERALRPYATPDGPFATLGGYADVLEATARVAPGVGVALAMDDGTAGGRLREQALDAWRDHGRAAHAAIESATTERHDGLFVARIDEASVDGDVAVETVARLLLAARSPEPAVLVASRDQAATAATDESAIQGGQSLRDAVATVGGHAVGEAGSAYATHDGDVETLVTAFREAEG